MTSRFQIGTPLFSFASSEAKSSISAVGRSNEDIGNDYIENDFLSPRLRK
jgi:hypothetical protein